MFTYLTEFIRIWLDIRVFVLTNDNRLRHCWRRASLSRISAQRRAVVWGGAGRLGSLRHFGRIGRLMTSLPQLTAMSQHFAESDRVRTITAACFSEISSWIRLPMNPSPRPQTVHKPSAPKTLNTLSPNPYTPKPSALKTLNPNKP